MSGSTACKDERELIKEKSRLIDQQTKFSIRTTAVEELPQLIQNLNDFISFHNLSPKNAYKYIVDFLLKKNVDDVKLKQEITALYDRFVVYINHKIERGDDRISSSKLWDHLITIGFSKSNATDIINYLQNQLDGFMDPEEIFHYATLCKKNSPLTSSLNLVRLHLCNFMPCFLDSFLTDSTEGYYDVLWEKLFTKLLNHRLDAPSINEPYLENRIKVYHLRRQILYELEKDYSGNSLKNHCINEECFKSISVCCSRDKLSNLIDNKFHTYWQANETEKCEQHWIIIDLKDNLKPISLSICTLGNRNDELLKTASIEVKIGNAQKTETTVSKCEYILTLKNDYLLCSCFPTDQVFTYLKIVILRTSNTLRGFPAKSNNLIKIKSIKLIGKLEVAPKNPRPSVMDASMCWYFDLVSSIALMQSQLMPALIKQMLNMSRTALDSMPPLSILHEKFFLSGSILEKASQFFKSFIDLESASSDEKAASILVCLEFNLARSHLKSILNSLSIILENSNLEYSFTEVIEKIDSASKLIFQESSQPINFKSVIVDKSLDETVEAAIDLTCNNEFELPVAYRNSSSSLIGTYNMLLELENGYTVTDLNIKIKPDITDLEGEALVFAFYEDKPVISDFDKFNEFDEEKYNLYMKTSHNDKSGFDVSYQKVWYNQVFINLRLPISHLIKYVFVKFLRRRESSELSSLYIKSLQINGCFHHQFELYKELKKMQINESNKNSEVTLPAVRLVNSVLWFLCQLIEHHKSMPKCSNTNGQKFIIIKDFEISDLWTIYELCKQQHNSSSTITAFTELQIPILILLYQLVNCDDEINSSDCMRSNKQPKYTYESIFKSLCYIIDASAFENEIIKRITKEILRNGLIVFFPDEQVRKQVFIQMIQATNEKKNCTDLVTESSMETREYFSFSFESTHIIFEAFCRLFAANKALLSDHSFDIWSECVKTLTIVDKLICFGFFLNDSEKSNLELLSPLNDLLNSVQSNIFFKIKQKLSDSHKNSITSENIQKFILEYATLVIRKCDQIAFNQTDKRKLTSNKNKNKLKTYLNKIAYNFVLLLSEVYEDLDSATCTALAESFVIFHNTILQVEKYVEEERPPIDESKILRSWSFNSQSLYTNSIQIDYSFPMADHFTIQFDPKCLLPGPQDTFTFSDSNETVHTFTAKTQWDIEVEIKSNTYIQFCLQPQTDKTFFLKFTVNAYSYPKLSNRVVLSDLLESVTCFLGSHFARIFYSDRFAYGKTDVSVSRSKLEEIGVSEVLMKNDDPKPNPFYTNETEDQPLGKSTNSSDQAPSSMCDLNSEFYRILFRGGCSTDKNNLNLDSNKKLLKFLIKLTNFYATIDSESSNLECIEFLKLYDTKSFTSTKTAFIYAKSKAGGIEVSEIILQIFACLVWHEPRIGFENVFREAKTGILVPVRNELVAHAFKTAEQTRMFIIEQQHQFKFKNQGEDIHKSNTDKTLVEIIRAKVMYLLTFERLSERLVKYEFNKQSWISPTINETTYDLQQHTPLDFASQTSAPTNPSPATSANTSLILNSLDFQKNTGYQQNKPTLFNRLPKCDSNSPINLIFQFIFDNTSQPNSLEIIQKILAAKKENASLIARSLELATKFLENIHDSNILDKRKVLRSLEFLLTFLSCFFSNSSNNKNISIIQASKLFPFTLQFRLAHYMQNLYGCGLEQESNIRSGYYKFVNFLLNVEDRFRNYISSDRLANNLLERLNLRFNGFLVNFLDMDWELYDWKFLNESKIIGYLNKNSISTIPITNYTNNGTQTASDVLEEAFSFNKEEFEKKLKKNQGMSKSASELKTPVSTPTGSDKKTLTNSDEVSFDLKIFPHLYQSLFQTPTPSSSSNSTSNSNRAFDTDSLFKHMKTEVKTYEQYEKFIVSRYMFWKYFSRLKANFYCDCCNAFLPNTRYVCLDCAEHCLCYFCFSRSLIQMQPIEDKTDDATQTVQPPQPKTYFATAHKSFHRMLRLSHTCDKCGSLIIGKRVHCVECPEFDLCLMCHKNFDSPLISGLFGENEIPNNHQKDHKVLFIEPSILVARPEKSLDIQVYLYLHTKMLFTSMTLRLSNLLSIHVKSSAGTNIDSDENADNDIDTLDFYRRIDFSYLNIKKVHYKCLRMLFFLIHNLDPKLSPKINENVRVDQVLLENLDLYVAYNQEILIGLVSSAVKISKEFLLKKNNQENLSFTGIYLDRSDVLETFFSSDFSETTESSINEQINLYQIIRFFLNLITSNQREEFRLDEAILCMIINTLKILLLEAEPQKVDLVVKSLIYDLKHKFDYLRLIDENDMNDDDDDEMKLTKELTLELLFNLIDESIECNQIGLAALYVEIISNLNANVEWRPKVLNFIDKIFSLIKASVSVNKVGNLEPNDSMKYSQSKLYNFMYALNCTPHSTNIGQWLSIGNNCPGQNPEPRIRLIKSFFYDSSSNSFNIWSYDVITRGLEESKNVKYFHDFRKPDETSRFRNDTSLNLKKSLVAKLIQLFKKLLTKYSIASFNDMKSLPFDQNDNSEITDSIANPLDESVSSKCGLVASGSPLKQKLLRYEIMHINRKKEMNQIFQQLQLGNNLLLLSVLTLIKEFILKKNSDDLKETKESLQKTTDSTEEEEYSDEVLLDYEFINLIAKLAFSNTNMNAYWKISHLRIYLVGLLLREGFENLKIPDIEGINTETEKTDNDYINKSSSNSSKLKQKFKHKTIATSLSSSNYDSATSNLLTIAGSTSSGEKQTSATQIDIKRQNNIKSNNLQTVEDLKLNLASLSVLGICDATCSHFSLSEMVNNSPINQVGTGSKISEALNDIRNKRSLKLLENCIEKLVKSAHTSSTGCQGTLADQLNCENRKKLLNFGQYGQLTNWLELQNCMSKFIQTNTGSNTTAPNKSVEEKCFKFSYAARSVNQISYKPLRSAIKLVSNATIVLTCRELLILFINWSLKQQHKKTSRQASKNMCLSSSQDVASTKKSGSSNKKLSIMQINCETEFELLQLLDILYYTDNSINYKLFIKNLITSLNQAQSENSDETQLQSFISSQTKVLIRISMMACEFMMPEYKLVRKVNWSSDDKSGFAESDTGRIKNKQINESIYEEGINFSNPTNCPGSSSTNYGQKQNNNEKETDPNLTSKPNDIEKLSTCLDSTLLIVFDVKKSQSIQESSFSQYLMNVTSAKTRSSMQKQRLKLSNFLRNTAAFKDNSTASSAMPAAEFKLPAEKGLNKAYLATDEYENKAIVPLNAVDSCLIEESDSERYDSEDSVNIEKSDSLMTKKKLRKKQTSGGIRQSNLDTFSSGSNDEYNERTNNNASYVDGDEEGTSCLNRTKLKKGKEAKKCRLFFQVIKKRRECNSNFDSANEEYDGNDSRYDDDDDEDEDDSDDTDADEDSYSDENTDRSIDSDSTNNNDDWDMIGDNSGYYADSDEEKFRKSTYKLSLEHIEFSPYLAVNNQRMLKWKFLRGEETHLTADSCSFKIYSSVSRNFTSAFYLLDELVDQLAINKFQRLNEIWNYLIKVACAQVFNRRLKVLSLLIKIMQKVENNDMDKSVVNIFSLKPLKSLQVTLELPNRDDRNLSRALYEVFYFAEKLAVKWTIQDEYKARLKDRKEIVERLCETGYYISMIMASVNLRGGLFSEKNDVFKLTEATVEKKVKAHHASSEDDTCECENDTAEEDFYSDEDECDRNHTSF